MIVDNKYISLYDELKAETVVSVIAPEVKHWDVLHKGYFYRNYHSDLINVDDTAQSIETSRNGLMKVLPEGLFFNPKQLDTKDDVKFKENEKKLEKERLLYASFFKPFDSKFFDLSLSVENFINDKCDGLIPDLLKLFFDIDYDSISNSYTKTLAPLILSSSSIKGNLNLITKLLAFITDCKVTYKISKLTITFIVHKRHLDSTGYKRLNEELKPLFEMVENWFMPMEYNVEYMVKDYLQHFVLSSERPLLLNYNTIFKI